MKQEHTSDVSHPLHIPNVRTHVTEGDQKFSQTCRKRCDLLEKIVEVREGPRNVSFDQVFGLARTLLAIGCQGRIHEIFVVLVERTGHSRLVADEERPCLPTHCQGYSTVLDVMTHLLLCLRRAWHANITVGFFLEQGEI